MAELRNGSIGNVKICKFEHVEMPCDITIVMVSLL